MSEDADAGLGARRTFRTRFGTDGLAQRWSMGSASRCGRAVRSAGRVRLRQVSDALSAPCG